MLISPCDSLNVLFLGILIVTQAVPISNIFKSRLLGSSSYSFILISLSGDQIHFSIDILSPVWQSLRVLSVFPPQ